MFDLILLDCSRCQICFIVHILDKLYKFVGQHNLAKTGEMFGIFLRMILSNFNGLILLLLGLRFVMLQKFFMYVNMACVL